MIQKEVRQKREEKREITAADLEKDVVEGKRKRKPKKFEGFVM